MANITFNQLEKANQAHNLNFIATADQGGDRQLSYTNLLGSLRQDLVANTQLTQNIYNYHTSELNQLDLVLCSPKLTEAGQDINIYLDQHFNQPKTVRFIKDRSSAMIRLNIIQGSLDGSRVNYYSTSFYDLIWPFEAVTLLFFEQQAVVLDRGGWQPFGTEILSAQPMSGTIACDGTFIFDNDQLWRRLNWLTSGITGQQDTAPFFLRDNHIIDLTAHFPRISGNRLSLETEEESLPEISGLLNSSAMTVEAEGVFETSNQTRLAVAVGPRDIQFFQMAFLASKSHATYGRRNEVAPQNYATMARLWL